MAKSIKDLVHNTVFYNYKDYKKPEEWEKGCILNMPEFLNLLNLNVISDYDGYGLLVYRNKVLEDSKLYLMGGDINEAHIIFNDYKIRLNLLLYLFKDEVSIIWYNK